jgi:hypothetical protein
MSGKWRAARNLEAQHSPHEETAEHLDLPKLLGHELQAHFKPLQDLPQRMFTLLMQLKNIRTPRGERSALPCSSKKAPPTRKGRR